MTLVKTSQKCDTGDMVNKEKALETARKWRAANKEKVHKYNQKAYTKLPPGYLAAQSRKWRAANPEKKRKEFKDYKERNPTWFKNYMRAWRRKKLTAPPPYEPPSHCEACGRPLLKPNLDHCHVTNRFRGWICNPCNAALGLAGDTAEKVRRLLDYIVRAEAMLDAQLLE
jgi:recombination endonuclease VII